MALAVLVAAVATGAWVVAEQPRTLAVSDGAPTLPPNASAIGHRGATPSGTGGVRPSGTGSASSALLVVDVAGKVRRPGLYRLPTGARIDDALRAAGGELHGVSLTTLNLAARVVDGQQIVVGQAGAAGPPAGTAGSGSGVSVGAPINLNTASGDQLQTLPGVGPVLAQHILDWRTEHGSFTNVDQLNDVPGIGEVKFAALGPLVTI